MNEVTEVVIALLMLVNGEMKEARIQTGYAECIKGARIAKRGLKINSSVKYSCIKCEAILEDNICLLYTSPSPRDGLLSRMPSSA